MHDRLLTLIRVDLARNEATLFVRGRFTTTNYRALVPLIRRARALPGNPMITVDISRAASVDSGATRLLLEACYPIPPQMSPAPVRITAPKAPSATSHVAPPVAA